MPQAKRKTKRKTAKRAESAKPRRKAKAKVASKKRPAAKRPTKKKAKGRTAKKRRTVSAENEELRAKIAEELDGDEEGRAARVSDALDERLSWFLKRSPVPKGVGRPTKYHPDLCEFLPAMFERGESVSEVCVALSLSKETFYRWVEEHPEFSNAYKAGLARSEAWWSRLGRAGAAGFVDIQPATWVFNMKNRFSWTDRIETEHSGEIRGGGIIVSPLADPEEWNKAAAEQQRLMKGNSASE